MVQATANHDSDFSLPSWQRYHGKQVAVIEIALALLYLNRKLRHRIFSSSTSDSYNASPSGFPSKKKSVVNGKAEDLLNLGKGHREAIRSMLADNLP